MKDGDERKKGIPLSIETKLKISMSLKGKPLGIKGNQ